MFELSDAARGLCLMLCVSMAAGAWCGGIWSVWRAYDCLPDGANDIPFFSADPRRITPEGRIWRGRVYTSIAWFILSALFVIAFRRG